MAWDNLAVLARQIWAVSAAAAQSTVGEEALMTSTELARTIGIPHDTVKKLLQTLKSEGFVQTVGMNPKRFRFDLYRLRQWAANDDAPPGWEDWLIGLVKE